MSAAKYSNSKYEGDLDHGRFTGEGKYTFPDGTVFQGSFLDGCFHGKGKLIFPNGVYHGTWVKGQEDGSGQFTFNDGLQFDDKDWDYCTVKDRRFWSEISKNELKPAGETNRKDQDEPAPSLLAGCYDVNDGYFDPSTGCIHNYDTGDKVREPDEEERAWIEKNAPIASSRKP